MLRISRSALFKRQFLEITTGYRRRAGTAVALKFVDQAEMSIRFVATKPLAWPVYTRLEDREFRKWGLQDFPVSLFFRLADSDSLVLEALYAHRMNITGRLKKDID